MMKKIATIFILISILMLTGCGTMPTLSDQEYQPVIPDMPEPKAIPDGGLFYSSTNRYIFEDIKATQVGDLLTVVLTEETNASKSASLEADKSSNIDFPNPTLFGDSAIRIAGEEVLTNSATANRDISGDGSLTQENSLDGNITVMVTDVLPNGYLVVRGEKMLSLNEGDEVVRISGIVRPTDVDSNNQVVSTKIANAQIAYKGNGAVSNSSKAGWLTKFFMHAIWPL